MWYINILDISSIISRNCSCCSALIYSENGSKRWTVMGVRSHVLPSDRFIGASEKLKNLSIIPSFFFLTPSGPSYFSPPPLPELFFKLGWELRDYLQVRDWQRENRKHDQIYDTAVQVKTNLVEEVFLNDTAFCRGGGRGGQEVHINKECNRKKNKYSISTVGN